MFEYQFSPSVDHVRVVAVTGRKGQPPILWEGPPSTNTVTIQREISRNRRMLAWLYENHFVRKRTATLDLQLQGFAKGKRIETHSIQQHSFIVRGRRRRKSTADEVVLRSLDLVENMLDMMKSMLEERDTVVGRLVERGLRPPPPAQAGSATQPTDPMAHVLTELPKLIAMAQSFKSMSKKDSQEDN